MFGSWMDDLLLRLDSPGRECDCFKNLPEPTRQKELYTPQGVENV